MNIKNWNDLIEFGLSLTTEQRKQKPIVWAENLVSTPIGFVEVMAEDHFNPSGDGCEPKSAYAWDKLSEEDRKQWESEEDYNEFLDSETVVVKAGEIRLMLDLEEEEPEVTEGIEPGDVCNRIPLRGEPIPCNGTIEVGNRVGECSCHLSAPCSFCSTVNCSECDYISEA